MVPACVLEKAPDAVELDAGVLISVEKLSSRGLVD